MKTIVVCGFGPGISSAVAERFGKEGYLVALVGRTASRLEEGVKALGGKGIKARAFPADLAQEGQVRALIRSVREGLGPISVVLWNGYGMGAGDALAAASAEVRGLFDVPVVSLLAATQEALPDLVAQKGALLVTNGGLGFFDARMDQVGVQFNLMGLSIANAAKHKLVGMLHLKLAPQGVYVGEIVVTGTVKGSAFDQGNGNLDPMVVADRFWAMAGARSEASVTV